MMRQKIKMAAYSLFGRRITDSVLYLGQSSKLSLSRLIRSARRNYHHEPIRCSLRRFGKSGHHIFFGYYDISPISYNNELLLAMKTFDSNILAKSDTSIQIGYYKLSDEKKDFIPIGETLSWCSQQGCRLQWYPEKSSRSVLYNTLVYGYYGCVIQDIETKHIRMSYKRPIYSVSKDGKWGLSINFSRLQRLRPGYGYVNFPDETRDQMAPENDGMWLIEMEGGTESFLFSLKEIANFEPLESMIDAEHYFNHILFNPSGTRFMFFHLWVKKGILHNRLITCDLKGSDRFSLINEGRVSHYTWKNDKELVVSSTNADAVMKYHFYRDKTEYKQVFGENILNDDGHPSFSPNNSIFLTDTYPDKYRDQHLLVFRPETRDLFCLGSFFVPLKNQGERRCDLHPRWSPSGRYICIDSAHEGERAMYLIDAADCLSRLEYNPI